MEKGASDDATIWWDQRLSPEEWPPLALLPVKLQVFAMCDKAQRKASWKQLREALNVKDAPRIVLILGAGVSIGTSRDKDQKSARQMMPSWRCLVDKLARGTQLGPVLGDAGADNWTQPRLMEAISAHYPEEGAWPQHVHDCLYEDLAAQLGKKAREFFFETDRDAEKSDKMADGRQAFKVFMEENNETLTSIVEFCAREESGSFLPNPRVAAVLTYNFDALLQKYDRARHCSPIIFRTISRASTRLRDGRLPLYHLHGLSEPGAGGDGAAAESLVLRESEYHERTDEPYSFATTTMLGALRDHVCVFIGCSMTDELMRRSLYRSNRELISAFRAVGKLDKWKPRHFAVMKCGGLDELIKGDLERLGVNPLWVDSFAELPEGLQRLREKLSLDRS